jgi:DNA-binding MarR family transcriptional regulator
VRLTRAGRSALAAITARSSGWRAQVAAKLSAAELEELHATLRKLLEAVKEGETDD